MSDVTAEEALAKLSLSSVSDLANELAIASDNLNDALREVEEKLAALNLGVSAAVPLEVGSGWSRSLAFRKEGSKWRLMVDREDTTPEVSFNTSPLMNVSREVRCQVAGRLKELYLQIVANAESQLVGTRQSLDKTRKFTQELVLLRRKS